MSRAPAFPLSEQKQLLAIARRSITAACAGDEAPLEGEPSDALQVRARAFVTLYQAGSLRGCVGTFDASKPVAEVVHQMAATAALRDHRFHPVESDEVKGLRLSISVLSPPRPVRALDEIEVGLHGLIVTKGYRRGVLLMKVAVENGWDRDEFLSATCVKAGLDARAWREFGEPGGITIDLFETFDFAE